MSIFSSTSKKKNCKAKQSQTFWQNAKSSLCYYFSWNISNLDWKSHIFAKQERMVEVEKLLRLKVVNQREALLPKSQSLQLMGIIAN